MVKTYPMPITKMNLYCETILNFYTLKNRKILCQIKVNPKSHKFKSTCRCLSEDQWKTFDSELEKLLTAKDLLNNEKCIKFNIKPYIEVKVQRSKLSYKYFGKLLGAVGQCNKGDAANVIQHNLILECLIDYQLEVPLSSLAESQEYDPQIDASADVKLCSQLQYEPYTPSKKKLGEDKIDIIKNISIDIFKDNEDTYSPKSIFEISATEPHLTQAIPKYIPAPIGTRHGSKERNKLKFLNDAINETDGEISYSDKHKPLKIKLSKKSKRFECEYIPKCQKVARVNVPVYIPTPIQETTPPQNLFKTDNIRQNKRRSNTIDVFPEQLNDSISELQLQKIEQLASEEKHVHCNSKTLKKRSMTIDKIPAALADMPVYTPTPKEETMLPEHLKTCTFARNIKPFSSIDVLPRILDENTKENYPSEKEQVESKKKYSQSENKNLKKRSVTIDEIPVALEEFNILHIEKEKPQDLNETFSKIEDANTSFEKKREKQLKASLSNEDEFTATFGKNLKGPSKNHTLGSDVKLDGSKIDKNMTLQKCDIDTHLEKALRKDRKMEVRRTETTKSFRRSERAPSKPKRLIEEQPDLVNKNYNKKPKSSPKNKELFGTDDDDDDDEHCFENNEDNKANATFGENAESKNSGPCNLSSSSMKSRRKIDKSSENVEEKLDIYKRLFQKKMTSLNEETSMSTKTTCNSSSSKLSSLKTSTKLQS